MALNGELDAARQAAEGSAERAAAQAAYTVALAQLQAGRTPGEISTQTAGASPQVVRSLALAVTRLEQPELRAGVLRALDTLDGPYSLDEVWGVWAETRHAVLEEWLCQRGLPASYPPEARVLSHLLLDQAQALLGEGAGVVGPLLRAAADEAPTLAGRARQALAALTHPEAQDELCRRVIHDDDEHARAAALQAGFAPREARQRALFFLLTGQWERYTGLDFDSSLLQAIYQTGSPSLRRKLAELARTSGWAGYVEALAGARSRRKLEQLSPAEWEVIQVILTRQHAWEELWRLAQAAPAAYSARLLSGLAEHGWLPPEEHEQAGFRQLADGAALALAYGAAREKLVFYRGELSGHTRAVTALAFNSDGALLASAAADRTVRLWPLDQPGPARVLEGHQNFVLALAMHPSGNLLASGGAEGSVRLWDLPGGVLRQQLPPQPGEAAALAFSPDGRWLASAGGSAGGGGAGGERGVVRLWRAEDGQLERVLKASLAQITGLAFSFDGQALAAEDAQKTIQIWGLDESAASHTLMETASAWDVSPAGPLIASAKQYGRVRLWRLPAGEMLATLRGADGELLRISPDGAWLAASDGSQVGLWELPASLEPAEISRYTPGRVSLEACAQGRRVSALCFDPTSRLLAAAGEDQRVRIWPLANVSAWQGGALPGVALPGSALPGGALPSSALAGDLLAELPGFSAPVRRLSFSPQGDVLACADQNVIRLWDLPDLAGLLRLPASQNPEFTRRLEALRRHPEIGDAEAAWLDFALAVQRWRGRYDIHVEEPARPLAIGEFDIILEG